MSDKIETVVEQSAPTQQKSDIYPHLVWAIAVIIIAVVVYYSWGWNTEPTNIEDIPTIVKEPKGIEDLQGVRAIIYTKENFSEAIDTGYYVVIAACRNKDIADKYKIIASKNWSATVLKSKDNWYRVVIAVPAASDALKSNYVKILSTSPDAWIMKIVK